LQTRRFLVIRLKQKDPEFPDHHIEIKKRAAARFIFIP